MNHLFSTASILLTIPLVSCQSKSPHVDVMYGYRDFETSSEWEQTDRQDGVLGIQAEFADRNSWGPEIGATYSSDGSVDSRYHNRPSSRTTSTVAEVYAGWRKNYMVNDWWQINGSGGISLLKIKTGVGLSYTDTPYTAEDTQYAPYMQLGTRAFVYEDLTIGFSFRYHFLNEDAEIFTKSPQLDGATYFLTLGYSF